MTSFARSIVLLIVISLLSCEDKPENPAAGHDLLIGTWFNPQYNDSIVTYEKSNGLVENEYSFSFQEDFTFIERKNTGWCGTPPISYADFEGTWTRNDSFVKITVGFWGGTVDYRWKILSLDESALKIERLEEAYHHQEWD